MPLKRNRRHWHAPTADRNERRASCKEGPHAKRGGRLEQLNEKRIEPNEKNVERRVRPNASNAPALQATRRRKKRPRPPAQPKPLRPGPKGNLSSQRDAPAA